MIKGVGDITVSVKKMSIFAWPEKTVNWHIVHIIHWVKTIYMYLCIYSQLSLKSYNNHIATQINLNEHCLCQSKMMSTTCWCILIGFYINWVGHILLKTPHPGPLSEAIQWRCMPKWNHRRQVLLSVKQFCEITSTTQKLISPELSFNMWGCKQECM